MKWGSLLSAIVEHSQIGGKAGKVALKVYKYGKAARAARYYMREEGNSEIEAISRAAEKYKIDIPGVRAELYS